MKTLSKLNKFGLNSNTLNSVFGGVQTGGGKTWTTCTDNTKNPSAGTCDSVTEVTGDDGKQISWEKCEWTCK